MAKRTATSELNHDNWDAEEEKETPGTFKPLSGSELKNRIIKKAKRSLGNKEAGAGSSPFAAFSGFTVNRSTSSPFSFLNKNAFSDDGNNSSSVTPKINEKKENGSSVTTEEKKTMEPELESAKKSTDASDKQKPIRSIEYYRHLQSLNESVMNWMQLHLSKNACCDFTPVFNDYKKHLDTLNVTYPVKGKESDIAEKQVFFKKPASEKSTVQKTNKGVEPFLNKNAFSDDGNNSSSVTSKINEEKENGCSVTTEEKKTIEPELESTKKSIDASDKQKPVHSIEYYRQSLNESVMNWVQLHLSMNPYCDFTPVFNDYKKYLDTLNVTYPVKGKESDSAEKQDFFKTPASEKSPVQKTINSSIKVSNNHKTDDETDYGAHFSSNTTNTSTFSFGIKLTPTSTSSSFSGPTTSFEEDPIPEKKPFQFSFGLKSAQSQEDSSTNKPFSFVSNPKDKSAESEVTTDDPEYVPPKNEFVAVKEEDAFYSKRCKLFFKKDDGYVERGVGTLHLKPCDGKTQLLIRADTSLGNILLNIMLSSSLPMSRTGKNNVLLVCVPNPPVDAKQDSKEAIPMLIRVKTSEDADELLETLNKHKS